MHDILLGVVLPMKTPPILLLHAIFLRNLLDMELNQEQGSSGVAVLPRIKVRRRQMCLLMKVLVNVVRRRRWREVEEQRRKRHRRYWVHPINELRPQRGHIGQLYAELRCYPDKFSDFCRMSVSAFDQLDVILANHLIREDTNMRRAISPTERLLITLRFLATGESYASLHLQFRVGKSTISGIVMSTCHVIWQHLQPISMPSPTQETWLQAAAGFQSVANFPNCIGAVDGKHIRVHRAAIRNFWAPYCQ
ncbi:uncharacterized protein LOC142652616 [Rhinoderma darwinii]|uniref:uncharacterized protein LOC142652616 n=1 Tax=Rhinoderma darwinii TaxID=43563 RepID=UPI003F67BF23